MSRESHENVVKTMILRLGSVRDMQERSSYCDTCRLFAGAADQLMKSTGLLPDPHCYIQVRGEHTAVEETIGDAKCSFRMTLSLTSPKAEKSSYLWSDGIESVSRKLFHGTIELTHGQYLVSTSIPQQTVDWQKISEWLRDCHYSAEHEASCQTKPTISQIPGLRVIDTRLRCIKVAPATCRYAALSYVWGTTSNHLQATTTNIDHLVKEGSLHSESLPQTIDDAIVACKKMGIDYLWDDDPGRKSYWLNSMGDIYAQSYVTIFALAGSNAEHGLPGVNKVKRPVPWVGTAQGICLVATPPNYQNCLRDSIWATRGWAFQEATLSTRRLLFSDTRVFYECCYPGTIQDEMYGSISDISEYAGVPLLSYSTVVENLTKGNLAWESDVLRALAGVLYTEVDRLYPTRNADLGDVFPTWSWSSIKGPIAIGPLHEKYWDEITLRTSLAIWAIPPRLGQQSALRVIANSIGESAGLEETDELTCNRRSYSDDCQALAVVIAWRSGCFSGSLPKMLNTEVRWSENLNILRKWKSMEQLCNEAHGMPQAIMSEQEMNARFSPDLCHGCLPGSTFAYTKSLDLKQLILSTRGGQPGNEPSVIEVDDFMPKIISGAIDMERINHIRQHSPDSLFTLLALSITRNTHTPSRGELRKEGVCWYDSGGNLMLVETKNGVSRRVGLAWAHLQSWVNHKRQFRTFHIV
ncbi:hypothetical protein BO83DRAFT_458240 [Aspergillus eucalypticola CBS 122712]|uniref:Heterokaryon incompatibility domain-containing protein n=1 Tax=Aspergillus eucalypticola (strain CBS 122712 / IBT 29274) TaxID=1448314 RepID=A0A317UL72_ASPEC|nr:uncharacterized protein BO83DRAFT_458240 [Aspergillus eucalypticola CBS 122712]PWY62703.1 hypothetical protein BO83DRAFT_458240 [Aspergillus eucalypticola CBS 122712]